MAIQAKPFTLDTVLRYRKSLEVMAKNRFFEAQRIHAIIKEKLATETENLHSLISQSEQLQAEGIEITTLMLHEEKISAAQKNVSAIEKNIQEKAKIVSLEKENLLRRSREHQVMQRLKYEQNMSWQQHLDKKEAAMLDEVAVMRHGKDPLDTE